MPSATSSGPITVRNSSPREVDRARPWRALATDFDGTVATDGVIDAPSITALEEFRRSGAKIILVTGRELTDLERIAAPLKLFDLIVAENGGVLFNPETGNEKLLAPPPDEKLIAELHRRGVEPLSLGRVILATWEPFEHVVLEAIKQLGVGYNVIFNKGAVMLLPAGIDKATGLKVALKELAMDAADVVGVGDAENDHAFLQMCGLSVAVSNAIPALKTAADIVTAADRGRGVTELLQRIAPKDPRA